MDELLKAHESIQSLDKSVAMLQMQSAAPMSSQEMSLDSSAAVSTLSREGSARKKVFMVIGINTDLVVERDVILLERLGCLKMDSQENWSMLESLVLAKEVAMWDAEFYVKVDDDVHVNLGMLASTDRHRSKPRVYIACMKSGPVLSQNTMNQSTGNLKRRETATSDMQLGRYTLSQKNLPLISPLPAHIVVYWS